MVYRPSIEGRDRGVITWKRDVLARPPITH
jgi:hypothetical protein